MAKIEKEEIITSYKGNVLFRLLSYLKSYKKNVAVISILCLLLTTIDPVSYTHLTLPTILTV